jgi:hypothetical protein
MRTCEVGTQAHLMKDIKIQRLFGNNTYEKYVNFTVTLCRQSRDKHAIWCEEPITE